MKYLISLVGLESEKEQMEMAEKLLFYYVNNCENAGENFSVSIGSHGRCNLRYYIIEGDKQPYEILEKFHNIISKVIPKIGIDVIDQA